MQSINVLEHELFISSIIYLWMYLYFHLQINNCTVYKNDQWQNYCNFIVEKFTFSVEQCWNLKYEQKHIYLLKDAAEIYR